MALTDTQKAEIIFFMGFPGKTLVSGSTNYSPIIADRLNLLTVDIESQVTRLIGKIKKVDDKLEESLCRFSTKKVDGIEINDRERNLLIAERRRLLKLLSNLLDVPLMSSDGVNISVCV